MWVELALGLGQTGGGVAILRRGAHIDRRVIGEFGELDTALHIHAGCHLAVGFQLEARLVVFGAGDAAGFHEAGKPREVRFVGLHLRLAGGGFAQSAR